MKSHGLQARMVVDYLPHSQQLPQRKSTHSLWTPSSRQLSIAWRQVAGQQHTQLKSIVCWYRQSCQVDVVQLPAAICLQVTAFWLLLTLLLARLLWQSMLLPWLSGRHSYYSIIVACLLLLPTAMRLIDFWCLGPTCYKACLQATATIRQPSTVSYCGQ